MILQQLGPPAPYIIIIIIIIVIVITIMIMIMIMIMIIMLDFSSGFFSLGRKLYPIKSYPEPSDFQPFSEDIIIVIE